MDFNLTWKVAMCNMAGKFTMCIPTSMGSSKISQKKGWVLRPIFLADMISVQGKFRGFSPMVLATNIISTTVDH